MTQNENKITQTDTFSLEHYFDKEDPKLDWKTLVLGILFVGLMVAVIVLYIGLAQGFYPPGRSQTAQNGGENGGTTDETSLTKLETRVSNLESHWQEGALQPVGGQEPVVWNWQINGRLQKRDSSDIFQNVLTIVKVKGQSDGGWQVVDVLPGGEVDIQYAHLSEPINVRVVFTNMPEGWQTALNAPSAPSASWRPVEGESNTFEARFESPQDAQAQQLTVNASVERTFSGMVTLGTSSEPAAEFPPVPRPNVSVHLEEQGADGQWRTVKEGVTGEDGRFHITYQSTADEPGYRLQAGIDSIYETPLLLQPNRENDADWLIIPSPQLENEVNLAYEVITVTLPVNLTQHSEGTWSPNPTADGHQYFITEATEAATASWTNIYLPPGIYKMEVWTPIEQGVNAEVQYIVDIDSGGISEAATGCKSYVSNQSLRNENWWDFVAENAEQTTLLVRSNGGNVTVTVRPSEAQDATLGLGPIRFVVIQGEPERSIVPCSE